jgi:hypothetical protein
MTPGRQPSGWTRLLVLTALLVAALSIADRFFARPDAQDPAGWTPDIDAARALIPAGEIESGLPVLSLHMDPASLDDPRTGLLTHVMEHGPLWERPGTVAFFDGGDLKFATGVGVRVHGGGSREQSDRQGFRLYFRREYGARQVPPGVLFSPAAQPIRRLVVHNDVRHGRRFINPLAYDYARAIGAIVPDTYPVRFFVNGEFYGVHVLTERIDEFYFLAHRGHDDVSWNQADLDALWEWTRTTRPLTMARVGDMVDLESLTRWFIAVAFAATGDAFQDPGTIKDLTRERSAWFWVNWDMDESFHRGAVDMYRELLNRVDEPKRGRNVAESRPTIIGHLLAEDAEYRAYYKRLFTAAMNHHLTLRSVLRRVDHHAAVAERFGVYSPATWVELKEIVQARVPYFWQTTEQWLNTGPSQSIALHAPVSETVTIDGEVAVDGFRGRYFPDQVIELHATGDGGGIFREWHVNGEPAGRQPTLRVTIDKPTIVEAVFADRRPGGAKPVVSPAETVVLTGPAGPGPAWVNIPQPRATQMEGIGPGPFTGMLAHEVTADAYARFSEASGVAMPRQPATSGRDHPVVNLTWDEARSFCAWTGGRLPTRDEWEYAATEGVPWKEPRPWGDWRSREANLMNAGGLDRWDYTSPVGSFPPNAFGLYDMIGNVWEWVEDLHETSTEAYEVRTIVGGSWDTPPRAFPRRTGLSRHGRHNLYVGFRCVR